MSGSKLEKYTPNITESIIIGSVGGAVEVLINHPFWVMKNRRQNKSPFTLHRPTLYAGIVQNMGSMVPITAVQVVLNNIFDNAIIAGIGAAPIACATEMVMTHQVKKVQFQPIETFKTRNLKSLFSAPPSEEIESFSSAGRRLLKEHSWKCLFKGLVATALRESVFTCFLFAGMPFLKSKIQMYSAHDSANFIFVGLSSGILATMGSQAFDTIKTRQQLAVALPNFNFTQAFKTLYSEGKFSAFFAGGGPRTLRVISALTILDFINTTMEEKFSEYDNY